MSTSARCETVRECAAAWHDRLQREKVTDSTRYAFARWLAESPEHRRAYEAIEETWSALQSTGRTPEILALRHETALRLTRGASRGLRPGRWAAAAAVVLAIGSLAVAMAVRSGGGLDELRGRQLLSWVLSPFFRGTNGTYATTIGERLAVTLDDGSQVTLDTQSELKVAFSKGERDVRLLRGQALFEVAKDRARPFVVAVRNRRFVAVGTAFDVRLDADRISVTMVRGVVRVERGTSTGASAAAPAGRGMNATLGLVRPDTSRGAHRALDAIHNGLSGRPTLSDIDTTASIVTTITAGEQLVVDSQDHDHVRLADPDRVTSWQRGQLIFDNTPLAEAVAELNRYSDTKIKLAEPALANLRISGAFATGRPRVFVQALSSYFPVTVASSGDRTIVLGLAR